MSIKLTTSDHRFSIVRPVISAPRLNRLWLADGPACFLDYVQDVPKADAVAIDLETRGTVQSHPDFKIVTIGLSCSIGSIALDVRALSEDEIRQILEPVIKLPLIGHNVYFDAAGLQRIGHKFENVNWVSCTYVLYKQLASEGFPGQSYGLKNAMVDMLGWETTNEEDRDLWLIKNGYVTDLSKLSTLDTEEKRIMRYNERDKNGHRKLHPDNGEMWRVPHDILGHYCALDCDATWQLYTQVLLPALDTIPIQAWDMHRDGFLPLIGILIDNHFDGITIDTEALSTYNNSLIDQITKLRQDFLLRPEVSSYIKEIQDLWIAEIPVPAQFKKNGKPSKNYINYLAKITSIREGKNEKLNKQFGFNINGAEMRTLLYEKLVQYEIVQPHQGPELPGKIRLLGGDGVNVGVELLMTDSGQLPMDGEAFQQMGPIGAALIELSEREKLQGYTEAGLLKTTECGDGIAHPQYRVHGTLTGRLSGGGDSKYKVNYQQLPGDEKYLSCYIPPQGYVFIQADVHALEPTVMAEISRDPTYMHLYGPDAKAEDVYLFIGTRTKQFRDVILAAGYDPDKPETLESVKKACKKERKVLKVLQLSSGYGAGVFKIWTTLRLQGVDISQSDVQQIYDDYWGPNLFGGVRVFQRELEREWRDNRGWVLDAIGCPTPVAEFYKKDLLNRVVQRSGHEILVLFLTQFLQPMLREGGVRFRWYIPDLHDETIYSVPKEQADLALEIHRKAVAELNEMLGGVTKIKMEPKIIHSLAERKD